MRILIADDEATTTRLVTRALERWGYTNIVAVGDGPRAWQELCKPNRPDIAILDWMMPGMTGIEICRKLREHQLSSYTYVILVTGKSELSDLMEGLDAGADEFLTKPLRMEELRVRIKTGSRIVGTHRELEALNTQLSKNRDELEQRVQERTKELAAAKEVAQEASRLKSDFLANMSHEIRTPLNGVVSMIELLLESELSAEQRQDAETIQECSATLRKLICDVLDFSKIEAGKLLLERSPFSLSDMIRRTVSTVRAQSQGQHLEVVVQLPEKLPFRIEGDELRLQQILTNLLSNACKFTPDGGTVTLKLAIDRTPPDAALLHFTISDTGIGIPAEKQALIFEAFTQADGTITRRFGGTGLGLSICRRLTDLMLGTINLASTEGVGTTFTLDIPCRVLQEQEQSLSSDAPPAPPPGTRILVADDNEINRRALRRKLTNQGYEVVEMGDPIEALQLLKKEPFDLLLLDVQMPFLSGTELTKTIRASSGPNESVPIIAVTAHAFTEDVERCRLAGMDAHVTKPIDYRALLLKMHALRESRRSEKEKRHE